ncbi:MAG: hypothetical protein ABSH41_23525, partial [Syntrophobacteraceae bacterium]
MDINERKREAREKTIRNAARSLAQYEAEHPTEKDGAYLNNGRLFDHGLRLTTRDQAQAETLLGELTTGERQYKKAQKLKDFQILCANLLLADVFRAGGLKPLTISMNPRDWTKKRYRHAGQFTIKAVHLLIDHKLISVKWGNEAVKRMTRIWPERSFTLRFPPDRDADEQELRHSEPLDLVVLKDSDGNLINYKDNRETNRIRHILRQNALVNDGALIQVHKDNAT